MVQLQKQNLACPDTVIEFDRGRLAVVRVGGATIGQAVFDPGWRWSRDVGRGVGAARCMEPHLGYVAAGRLMVELDDGTCLELGPGDIAAIPSGHDAWTMGDSACVFFEFPPPGAQRSHTPNQG